MTILNEEGVRAGLIQVTGLLKRLRAREQWAAEAAEKAADELNDIRSMIGFAEQTRESLHYRLRGIEEKKQS